MVYLALWVRRRLCATLVILPIYSVFLYRMEVQFGIYSHILGSEIDLPWLLLGLKVGHVGLVRLTANFGLVLIVALRMLLIVALEFVLLPDVDRVLISRVGSSVALWEW